jgi:hypothetical protein
MTRACAAGDAAKRVSASAEVRRVIFFIFLFRLSKK